MKKYRKYIKGCGTGIGFGINTCSLWKCSYKQPGRRNIRDSRKQLPWKVKTKVFVPGSDFPIQP